MEQSRVLVVSDSGAGAGEIVHYNERYRALVESSPDLIIETDLRHTIQFCNTRALHFLGIGEGDSATGRHLFEFLSDTDIDKARDLIRGTIDSGECKSTDFTLSGPGGEVRIMDVSASLLRDSAGNPASVILVLRDITERIQLQQQQIRVQKFESVGTLANGIAHDFNNILNTISGFSEQLKVSHTNPDKVLKYATILEKAAQRGIDLTKQLSKFVKQSKTEKDAVHIEQVLEDILSITRETFPDGITIATKCEDNLPTVFGNRNELYQLLLNLVINARDAMPSGGSVSVSASRATLPEGVTPIGGTNSVWHDRTGIELRISDTGTGIPENIRMKIFDPFFTTKDAAKGTGLGLTIVFTILRDHHGAILLESEVGKGTTFRIFLPVVSLQDEPCETETEVSGNGEVILLVDDDEAMQQLGLSMLERAGYQVIQAQDGPTAVELFRNERERIALVILDLMMPNMGGNEVYEELVKVAPDVKALFYTGFSNERALESIAKNNKIRICQKPLRTTQFVRIVQETIAAH